MPTRWLMVGSVTSLLVLTGGVWVAMRSSVPTGPVAHVETSPPAAESDLAHAPADVQACISAIIGAESMGRLTSGERAANEGEQQAIESCFRQVNAGETVEASTSPTPSRSPSTTAQDTSKEVPMSKQIAPSSQSTSSGDTPTSSPAPSPTAETKPDIFAEVWSKNGYDGASYEYKVNCGPNYATLETCFLWDLTRVAVTAPEGWHYALKKDFNRNSYSGEVTRRWVLYGPAGGGLPVAGTYTFRYYNGDTEVYSHTVQYTPSVVEAPTGIVWERTGNTMIIRWQAPAGISSSMWYKPGIDPPGNDRSIINKIVAWDQTSVTLENPPLNAGETIEINVAVFFPGGYAYPAPLVATWE